MLHMPGPSVHPKPKIDKSCKDPTVSMDEEETAKYILGWYWGMEDLQVFVVLVVLNHYLR